MYRVARRYSYATQNNFFLFLSDSLRKMIMSVLKNIIFHSRFQKYVVPYLFCCIIFLGWQQLSDDQVRSVRSGQW